MSKIKNYITNKNLKNEKILSIFLTAGFPDKNKFTEIAIEVFNSGADMLEIGIPFSDPLADGPIIQTSSQIALQNNVTMKDCFSYSEKIKSKMDKPIIAMSYANPIFSYGIQQFLIDAKNSGIDGLIIPDLTIEEYDNFFNSSGQLINNNGIDIILLVTPTTPIERAKLIDEKSEGFIYYVSTTGTTGIHSNFNEEIIEPLKKVYESTKKNKLLVGFGIYKKDDVMKLKNYCDGVIVGSAAIKELMHSNYDNLYNLVKELKSATY